MSIIAAVGYLDVNKGRGCIKYYVNMQALTKFIPFET